MKTLFAFALILGLLVGSAVYGAPAVPPLGVPLPTPDKSVHLTPILLPAPSPMTWVDAVVLTANSAATYTIPSNATYLMFSANGIFYVSFVAGQAAAIPSSSVTTGAAPFANPVLVPVQGLTSISIIAPSACIVTIAVFGGVQ